MLVGGGGAGAEGSVGAFHLVPLSSVTALWRNASITRASPSAKERLHLIQIRGNEYFRELLENAWCFGLQLTETDFDLQQISHKRLSAIQGRLRPLTRESPGKAHCSSKIQQAWSVRQQS